MLYLIRHGRTDWNDEHRLQGRTDVPLNDNGRKMAEDAHDRYADVHFDVCYCSPLIRARETAEILLKDRDVPIIPDDRLKEMCFGIYEGESNSFEKPGCEIKVLFKDPAAYDFEIEGAESWDDLFSRTGEFLKEVVNPLLKQGKDVLVVGHGAMNSCLTCQILRLPISEFWSHGIENCVLKEFDYIPD